MLNPKFFSDELIDLSIHDKVDTELSDYSTTFYNRGSRATYYEPACSGEAGICVRSLLVYGLEEDEKEAVTPGKKVKVKLRNEIAVEDDRTGGDRGIYLDVTEIFTVKEVQACADGTLEVFLDENELVVRA